MDIAFRLRSTRFEMDMVSRDFPVEQLCEISFSNSVIPSNTHGNKNQTLYPVSDNARREARPLSHLSYRKKAISMRAG